VWATLKCALSNYRAWVLLLTYGYCFGVELTMEDTIVSAAPDEQGRAGSSPAQAVLITAGGPVLSTRCTGGRQLAHAAEVAPWKGTEGALGDPFLSVPLPPDYAPHPYLTPSRRWTTCTTSSR
jgi:hypothetical protein